MVDSTLLLSICTIRAEGLGSASFKSSVGFGFDAVVAMLDGNGSDGNESDEVDGVEYIYHYHN